MLDKQKMINILLKDYEVLKTRLILYRDLVDAVNKGIFDFVEENTANDTSTEDEVKNGNTDRVL